jgi:pimeloyl-ACP methyl ester carboxylesterase
MDLEQGWMSASRPALIDSGRPGLRLFLRGLRSAASSRRGAVLYLHGATFPSALSVAFRFDGVSWRDAHCSADFDVWSLDFLGFGGSDRYPEMEADADANAPLGLAAEVVAQVEAAVQFILDQGGHQQVSLVTHSWGSMPAGLFAAKHPTLVDRIVMFAPLARREGPRYTPRPTLPAWKLDTNEQQWARFIEDVPPSEPPVLARDDFTAWAEAYLDSDPAARSRSPSAVKTPTGPLVEILSAWHGELAWEPCREPRAVRADFLVERRGFELLAIAVSHLRIPGFSLANLKGDVRQTGGANYDLSFACKPQIPLAFVPQESNGHDVLKAVQAPAGQIRR